MSVKPDLGASVFFDADGVEIQLFVEDNIGKNITFEVDNQNEEENYIGIDIGTKKFKLCLLGNEAGYEHLITQIQLALTASRRI